MKSLDADKKVSKTTNSTSEAAPEKEEVIDFSKVCKAAPDMTHGLKNIGDGDMKEGMKIMVDFFEENGMRKGALLGATATLAGVGLIVGAKKLYSMKKVHKEKGEKILNGLKQGIENELTESIEDYECTKESEKAENIQADNV